MSNPIAQKTNKQYRRMRTICLAKTKGRIIGLSFILFQNLFNNIIYIATGMHG
jgi:hypothetical protein